MAISNTETHVEVARLAEEQAALRRVATLVAEGAAPTAVFDAVAAEIERLLDAEGLQLSRYEPDDELTIVAHRGLGARAPAARLARQPRGRDRGDPGAASGRPARVGFGDETGAGVLEVAHEFALRSAVGAPLALEGQLWGVAVAYWRRDEPAPPAAKRGWRSSPSCSRPRSPTRTAATSCEPPGRACSRRATRPAAAWCGTCTTGRSSASCTRSWR